MTVTDRPVTTATHPLARLTAEEITAASALVADAGLVGEHTRFVYVGLEEPHKRDVARFSPGDPVERRVRVLLLDRATGVGHDVTVSVTARRRRPRASRSTRAADGQVPILDEEFEASSRSSPPTSAGSRPWPSAAWTSPNVRSVPLSAGVYGYEDEVGHADRPRARVPPGPTRPTCPGRTPSTASSPTWTSPAASATAVHDHFDLPVPAERGDFDAADVHGADRDRPEADRDHPARGAELHASTDDVVTLGRVAVPDRLRRPRGPDRCTRSSDRRRGSVVYRASIAEMVVPYADPSPVRFWQNYFDTGEYLVRPVRQLPGAGLRLPRRDPLLRRHASPTSSAHPATITQRDLHARGGLRRPLEAHRPVQRHRRDPPPAPPGDLASSPPIGNYDYGFYWYLYLDGTIQLEGKATGIVFTSAYPGRRAPVRHRDRARAWARRSTSTCSRARLDMAVDGARNAVDEVDAVRRADGRRQPVRQRVLPPDDAG